MLLPFAVSFALAAPPAPSPAPPPAGESVPALIEALADCQEMDCPALRSLVARGDKVWPELERGIDHKQEMVRFWSIGVLSEVPVAAAMPRLLGFIKDEPLARIRAASAFALASYKGAPEVTPALVLALSDIDPNVRFEAASALGRRPADPAALAPLVKALDDQDEDVRAAAAETLGVMGPVAKVPEATKALLAKVSDRKPTVRGHVAIALGQIGVPEAVPPLVKRLERERDEEALAAAIWALGELGDKTAVEPLKALEGHASEIVRGHVAEALGKLAAVK
ncbi:MAG: HEAT repeat domain-containing protein [Myxococcota bacterium]